MRGVCLLLFHNLGIWYQNLQWCLRVVAAFFLRTKFRHSKCRMFLPPPPPPVCRRAMYGTSF